MATSVALADNFAAGLGRTRAHTKRGEVHQTRESHNPVVHGVDDVTSIELEGRLTLGI